MCIHKDIADIFQDFHVNDYVMKADTGMYVVLESFKIN